MSELTGPGAGVLESKLIPIMREGVGIIKMVLFKEMRDSLAGKYAKEQGYAAKLAGAVINELFGTPNLQPEFIAFTEENRKIIATELTRLPFAFEKLRIPLTDALRVQFLCDSMEGIDSQQVLLRAKELQILIIDRELPLPHNFLNLVRHLGGAHGLIQDTVEVGNPPGCPEMISHKRSRIKRSEIGDGVPDLKT
jgi:hypothetical protein